MTRFLRLLIYLTGMCLELDAAAAAIVDLRLFPFSQSNYNLMDAWDFHLGEDPKPRPLSIVSIIPREHGFGDLRHGTFHIKLRLPEPAQRFAMFFPELRSASRVTINGKIVSAVGTLGRNLEEERPAMRPFIVRLEGEAQELDIKVELSAYSNYQFLSSSTPISIGYQTSVFEKQQAAKIRDSFAVGAIFIMAFYHFALFALRRERIDPLLFGLFCTSIGMRSVVRSDGLLLYQLFERPDFYWHYRFEYWGINIPAATCAYFIYVLFHKSISKTVIAITIGYSLLYAVAVGILPLWMHGVLLIPFEIAVLITAAYLVKGIAQAKPDQRDGSFLMAAGFVLFMLATLNDILKNHGLMKTVTLSHIGLVAFILCQAIIISKRFSRAFSRVKDAEFEIRQLNDDLELKVKDRTQTIRIILDNVKAGFLLVGADLAIKEGFTRSCQEIIGREIWVGQNFQDLFDLTDRERVHFQLAIDQIFSGLMPDDVSLSQIQSRISIGPRIMSLQGAIVREEESKVHAILFTITDVTVLVKAEQDAKINQTLLTILQDKVGFQSFIVDSLRDLKLAEEAIGTEDATRIRLILHTLKGNFATYGLEDVARAIHRTEDLDDIRREELDDIAGRIRDFMSSHQDLIGLDLTVDASKGVFVPYMAIENLRQSLMQAVRVPVEVLRFFEVWVQEIQLVPIRLLFSAMLNHTSRVASQLGKDVDIHVTGGETLVNPERISNVISNLSHMLRNSIDHGIEMPENRAPKPAKARIDLIVQRDAQHLILIVQDDGQGLDMERIREVAVEKRLVTHESFDKASERERAHYIFLAGFSTSTSVTEISGRGVGMASLAEAVRQLGGQIEVESKRGQGCRFEIRIPDTQTNSAVNRVA